MELHSSDARDSHYLQKKSFLPSCWSWDSVSVLFKWIGMGEGIVYLRILGSIRRNDQFDIWFFLSNNEPLLYASLEDWMLAESKWVQWRWSNSWDGGFFDKYWEEYSDILAITTVLDWRLKFACLEYCFTTLDAATTKTKMDHIRKKMKKLFYVYKKNTKKNVVGTSRSNSSE